MLRRFGFLGNSILTDFAKYALLFYFLFTGSFSAPTFIIEPYCIAFLNSFYCDE
jgi:hypothetical protein